MKIDYFAGFMTTFRLPPPEKSYMAKIGYFLTGDHDVSCSLPGGGYLHFYKNLDDVTAHFSQGMERPAYDGRRDPLIDRDLLDAILRDIGTAGRFVEASCTYDLVNGQGVNVRILLTGDREDESAVFRAVHPQQRVTWVLSIHPHNGHERMMLRLAETVTETTPAKETTP